MKNYYKPAGSPVNHSMDWMLQAFDLDIQNAGVYHVGAHLATEGYIYHGLGAQYIIWLECNPLLQNGAMANINEWRNRGFIGDRWINIAATDQDDQTLKFHFYNSKEDGTSSLLEPDGILEKIPTTSYLGSEFSIQTITLDTLIDREKLPYKDVKLLNVDTQGTELLVFKGAQKLLNSPTLKYILCEVSFESLYKDGALIYDIDNYLQLYGFKRVHYRLDCIPTHGDGIYIRTN